MVRLKNQKESVDFVDKTGFNFLEDWISKQATSQSPLDKDELKLLKSGKYTVQDLYLIRAFDAYSKYDTTSKQQMNSSPDDYYQEIFNQKRLRKPSNR
jgi:hypothetical protein